MSPIDVVITYYDQYQAKEMSVKVTLDSKFVVADNSIIKMAIKKEIDNKIY